MKEEIKISEKVKFWDEQKKINDSLIPRVIEMSKILELQSRNIKEYSNSIVKLEERLHSKLNIEIKAIKKLQIELNEQKKIFYNTIKENEDFYNNINKSIDYNKNKIDGIENSIKSIKINYDKKYHSMKVIISIMSFSMILIIIYLIMRVN